MMLSYFLHVQLWAHAHRQVFHCGVDTNNITESFNHVLRQRYLPLRHDTTIFALVQILVEVVFPEQEIRYIQATIKQTAAYRKPKYELPQFLQEKPHTIQSICLMNIERAKAIPKSHVTQKESVGVYSLASSSSGSEQSWTVNIPAGLCTCPSFLSAHIPCKHMFAIFHHHPQWSWHNLPKELTCSSHMTLDHQATAQMECDPERTENDSDDLDTVHSCSSATPSTTGLLPSKINDGRRVYRLQKSVEYALGQCRTLAFLTNDIPTLQTALDQCKVIVETLTSSSTISMGPKVPPVFHSIAKAGVEEFKASSKTLHRVGVKRKRNGHNQLQTKKPRKEAKPTCRLEQEDALSQVAKRQPGRPRLKRPQRKRPPLPRQVSTPVKQKMLKAAAILQRGKPHLHLKT